MPSSFGKLATVSASTKRAPAISGGKRGTPTTNLTGLSVTPLDPVDPELRERLALETSHELLQTFVEDATNATIDIAEGDLLTVGGTDYPIRSVAEWTYSDGVYYHLILEDLKR